MKFLTALLLLLPSIGFSQLDIKDLQGKWLEEKRSTKKEKEITFTDTMRIEIREDGFMMLRLDQGGTFVGAAELSESRLKLEDLSFEIEEFDKDKLILKDKSGSHHFKKKIEFSPAPIAKATPGVGIGKSVDTKTLQGKWTMYKKTDPDYDPSTFYIRVIQFMSGYEQGEYKAKITFNNADSVYFADVIIKAQGSQLSIICADKTINLNVLTTDSDNELILEDRAIHYYMKQFGKKN